MALNFPEVPWAPMLDFQCMLDSSRQLTKLSISGFIPDHWVSRSRFDNHYYFLIPLMMPLPGQGREPHHLMIPVSLPSILNSSHFSIYLVSSPDKEALVKKYRHQWHNPTTGSSSLLFSSRMESGSSGELSPATGHTEPLSVHRSVHLCSSLANCI